MQGLQVLADADTGLGGGAATAALTGCADDYPRTPVVLYALQHSQGPPTGQGADQVSCVVCTDFRGPQSGPRTH